MEPGDLDCLREWFAAYCLDYHGEDEADNRNYSLKETHTGHVRENMDILTGSIMLAARERMTAEAIALFHDVGRFEQYRRFATFRDDISINHALLGVRVLAENRVLEGLEPEERRSILRAVSLHNVYLLPDNIGAQDVLYARLIRDADKLDIWRVFVEFHGQPEAERASAAGLGFPDLPECSPEVVECIEKKEMVRLSLVKSLNDFTLLQLSWVFDLNLPESFRLALDRGLLRGLAAALPEGGDVGKALGSIMEYAAVMAAGGGAHA